MVFIRNAVICENCELVIEGDNATDAMARALDLRWYMEIGPPMYRWVTFCSSCRELDHVPAIPRLSEDTPEWLKEDERSD